MLRRASCEECRKITHAFEDMSPPDVGAPAQPGWARREGSHGKDRERSAPKPRAILRRGCRRRCASRSRSAAIQPSLDRDRGNSPRHASERHRRQGAVRWSAWATPAEFHTFIDHDAFQRMVAKIAYGFAVASYGLNAFYPLVLELIRGKEAAIGKYITRPPAIARASHHVP